MPSLPVDTHGWREVCVVLDLDSGPEAQNLLTLHGAVDAYEIARAGVSRSPIRTALRIELYISDLGARGRAQNIEATVVRWLWEFGIRDWPVLTSHAPLGAAPDRCTRVLVVVATDPPLPDPSLFLGFR